MSETITADEDRDIGLGIGPSPGRRPIASAANSFAAITDRGRARRRNEDCAFALVHEGLSARRSLTLGVFLVADGMGGQADGDRASAVAIQAASECLLREVVLPLASSAGADWPAMPIHETLELAFSNANERVLREVAGGGATLTAALLIGRRVYVGHVGDCRLYLLRSGELRLLTRDHSLLSRLIELGQIEPAADITADQDPRRNSLYQAIGQAENPEADIFSQSLEHGDGLLLCCDGLWSTVRAEEMAAIITASPSPAEACHQLVSAANAAGGPDNITVILVYPLNFQDTSPAYGQATETTNGALRTTTA